MNLHVADAGHVGRHEAEVEWNADPRQHQRERTREQGHHQRLGDLGPEELQPAGPDRPPHRQLPLPPLGP